MVTDPFPSARVPVFADRSGMTLIEVMIASVVALVIGLAFAEMNAQQAKVQKRLQIRSEAQNFHNYVRFLVINTAAETVNNAPPSTGAGP